MLAALLATAALAPALAAGGGCAAADARASSIGPDDHARSVQCLVNAERRRRGIPRLQRRGDLALAAARHSRDMVRRGFFDHTSPGGSTPSRRVQRTGYPLRSLGETIAWGTGSYGTPAGIVEAWMDSPPHRRILLDERLRDIGVGVALGSPESPAASGATVTADLGRR